MSKKLALLTTVSLFTLSVVAQAQSSLAAHTHGNARLQVAIDGQRADLIFTSPAYNLVGFEFAPRTDAQHQAMDTAQNWLQENSLLAGAGCRLVDADVTHTLEEGHGDDGHHGDEGGAAHHGHSEDREDATDHGQGDKEHHKEDDAHEDDHHEDAHHDDAHSEHGELEQAEQEDGETHSEFSVSQSLECDQALDGATVTTPLSARFDNLQQLNVEWVSSNAQGAARLEGGKDTITFSR